MCGQWVGGVGGKGRVCRPILPQWMGVETEGGGREHCLAVRDTAEVVPRWKDGARKASEA